MSAELVRDVDGHPLVVIGDPGVGYQVYALHPAPYFPPTYKRKYQAVAAVSTSSQGHPMSEVAGG